SKAAVGSNGAVASSGTAAAAPTATAPGFGRAVAVSIGAATAIAAAVPVARPGSRLQVPSAVTSAAPNASASGRRLGSTARPAKATSSNARPTPGAATETAGGRNADAATSSWTEPVGRGSAPLNPR